MSTARKYQDVPEIAIDDKTYVSLKEATRYLKTLDARYVQNFVRKIFGESNVISINSSYIDTDALIEELKRRGIDIDN